MSKVIAVIQEHQCVGCTKCIDACPVDAILGSMQFMHTVISDECIGCKLCIPPCPMDCIDLITISDEQPRITPEKVKKRYQARRSRLQLDEMTDIQLPSEITAKRDYIAEARARVKRQQSSKEAPDECISQS